MRRTDLEEMPNREGIGSWRTSRSRQREQTHRRWLRGRQVEQNCSTRMRRLLRSYVGKRWQEAQEALHRLCATLDVDRVVADRARTQIEAQLSDHHRLYGGVSTSEGRLFIDTQTNTLLLRPRVRRNRRTYSAVELRREPIVIHKGRRNGG